MKALLTPAVCIFLLSGIAHSQPFIRGDANNTTTFDIGDTIFILDHLYGVGPAPLPVEAAGDANDNGVVEISDVAYSLLALFQGGPLPPAPFPTPGLDPTPDNFPTAPSGVVSYELSAPNACAGNNVTASLFMSNSVVIEAFSVRMTYDPLLTFLQESSAPLTSLLGGPPDFFAVNTSTPGVILIGGIPSLIDPAGGGIPAGTDQRLIDLSFNVDLATPINTLLPIRFVDDTTSTPREYNLTSVSGQVELPTLIDGGVFVDCSVNSDYELSISSASAPQASNATVTVALDNSNGLPVEAISFGVCNATTDLNPLSAQMGSALTILNGGSGPDFFQVDVTASGFTMEMVVSSGGTETIPVGASQEILELTYSVLAGPGAVAQVFFCSLGTPTVDVEVTAGGVGTIPVQVPGQISIGVPGTDYTVLLSNTTGQSGGAATTTATLDSSNGIGIQGFAVGICNDPALVTPTSTALGSDLAVVNAGAGPDFFQAELFPDGATGATVIDFTGSNTIPPAAANEILLVNYDILAPSGTTVPLTYCDTLGVPPVTTTVVAVGTAIPPMRVNGMIDVMPPAPATLSIDSTVANPGVPFEAAVLLTNDQPVSSFRFGLIHDSAVFDLSSITPAAAVSMTNGGAGPDVFTVSTTPAGGSGGTVDCVISSQAPFDTLPVATDVKVAVFTYGVLASPCTVTALTFSDTLGSPAVPIEVNLGGSTITPAAITGSVTVGQPLPAPPSGGYTITAGTASGAAGSTASVGVFFDNEDEVQAFSFGLEFDPTNLDLDSVGPGLNITSLNCGNGPEYFSAQLFSGGATVGCLITIAPPFIDRVLPPGSGQEAAVLLFDISAGAPDGPIPLEIVGTLGSPVVPIEFTVDTAAVVPTTVAGAINVGAGGGGGDFTRGDCNNDGTNNIADTIFLLDVLFPSGPSSAPDCSDSCDTNDDGSLNVADAVTLLDSLFGMPAIVLPAPTACGADPTSDALDCVAYANCP